MLVKIANNQSDTAIEELKKVELQAKQIKEGAQQKKDFLIQEAKEKAMSDIAETEKTLEKKYDTYISKKKKEIDKECETLIENSKKEIDRLKSKAEKKVGSSADTLVSEMDEFIGGL